MILIRICDPNSMVPTVKIKSTMASAKTMDVLAAWMALKASVAYVNGMAFAT